MGPSWSSATPADRTVLRKSSGGKRASGMLLGAMGLLLKAAFPFLGAEARTSPVQAAANDSARHDEVIMLVVDALSVDDFTVHRWTHLRAVASHGAIGLMSTRAAG